MKVILAPTDFSPAADNAVRYAAHLAKATGAHLHLSHVFHIPLPAGDVPVVPDVNSLEVEYDKRLEKLAKEIETEFGIIPGFKASLGFAAEALRNAVSEYGANMVVMGMRGHSAVSKFLLGSTTTSFLDNSDIPVLIVPEDIKFHVPKWIAYATDLKDMNLSSLDLLKEVAVKFKSRLYILNVSPKDQIPDYEKSISGISLEHYLEEINHLFFFPEGKDVVAGIDDFTAQHQVDWVAMVPHKYGWMERLFHKSMTREMAYHTTVPLLILPEKNRPEIID